MISKKIFFQNSKILIINDSVFKTKIIPPNSVDLVITSPPYNVDIKYNSHDDQISYEKYKDFSKKWMSYCYKWLKNDGKFCLNVPLDKNKGGQQSVGADLTEIAKEVGFNYYTTIIWNEGNISRRTAWGSWKSASAPYVIAPVELIIVFFKKIMEKTSGSQESDMSEEEFSTWTNGFWSFSGESKKRIGHPAPFPIELPRRCMKLFSFKGDTVLDPFLGSGSTLVACYKYNRKGIGIDIDPQYCRIALKRLENECGMGQTEITQFFPQQKTLSNEAKNRLTQSEIILQYFRDNPTVDLTYEKVNEWLKKNYPQKRMLFFDRTIRSLVESNKLIRVQNGLFRLNK
nr:site-specific DNA-methyltransferase [uncultured Methanoregula sp.]